MANGCNDLSESESDLGERQDSDFDPAIEMSSQTSSQASSTPLEQNAKASTASSSQPLPKSTQRRKSTTGAKSKALTQTKPTKKIGRVKKPLDAVELTQRNFDIRLFNIYNYKRTINLSSQKTTSITNDKPTVNTKVILDFGKMGMRMS